MAEMTLMCAVYGEASTFRVTIACDADVIALREAIFDKQRYELTHPFPASALTLYLARKTDGEWLKLNNKVMDFLRGEIDPQYAQLLPGLSLNDEDCFGEDFEPKKAEIHVLVQLPERVLASAEVVKTLKSLDEESVKLLQEIHGYVKPENKRKRYVHSEVGSTKGKELLQALDIKLVPVEDTDGQSKTRQKTAVAPFQWEVVQNSASKAIKLTEEQHRTRYLAYVEQGIGRVLKQKRLCVVGVERGQNLLSVPVPGRHIDLSGRADILVLSEIVVRNPDYMDELPGVKLLIEVKREVKPGAKYQAVSELIALDLLSDNTVMALLTDLNKHWEFFWVSEKRNDAITIQHATIKNPGDAFDLIQRVLEQDPQADADTGTHLPCLEGPVKRRKLKKMLPTISEGDGDSSGIRAAIERYYDIASVLGPDIDLARETANQLVRTIPTFSFYT